MSLCFLNTNTYASDYTKTKYPVVLVHGLFGFDDIIGIDYFYRIPQELRAGGTEVYVAKVSAANDSELRGEQLLKQVRAIRSLSGSNKVHLIGHSHGAQTIRYVASVKPKFVASVTSVGGVNWGSTLADVVRGTFAPESFSEKVIAKLTNAMSKLIELLSGHKTLPVDSVAALASLTTKGSIAFNKKYPEGVPASYCGNGKSIENGVRYYSWSGTGIVTNIFDISDYTLLTTSSVFTEPNDGLVSACSSHLGLVLKDNYPMNHADEINQILGIYNFFTTNPVSVYRNHVNRLKKLGL